MIIEQMIVGHMQVCCYIVGCPEAAEAILIDPAGDEDRVTRRVKDLGMDARYVVNTHGHPDHTCGNQRIKDLTGAQVIMHELDDDLSSDPRVQAFFRQMGFVPVPPADIRIQDGYVVTVGDVSLTCMHTPGHTPGSICLYGEGNLFTGDTLFVGAVGRTDLPGGSMNVLLKSLKERVLSLPETTVVWPGHDYGDSPSSTLRKEKRTNPYITEFVMA